MAPQLKLNKKKIIYSTLVILFGVFLFIYGGIDDSPGGQLLGLVLSVLGIWNIIRLRK